MRRTLNRAVRRLASVIDRLKDDQSGEIPAEAGFHFSAWFFLTVVALTFLDAYLLQGKGIGQYLSVPADVLANASGMVNG